MIRQDLLEASREEAETARKKLKQIEDTPTGITGGGSAAGHTVTRTAMRKNTSNISRSTYIKPVLDFIADNAPHVTGIIPHPIAWDVMEDGDTYYLHEIDGAEIECVYTKSDGEFTFHHLTADGQTLVDQDTAVPSLEKKDTKRVIIAAIAVVMVLTAVLLIWAYA